MKSFIRKKKWSSTQHEKVSEVISKISIKSLLTELRDERGSVEAGLTLIPLTFLFLLAVQLVFTSQWGNWQRVTHQSSTDVIAIRGIEGPSMGEGDLVRHEPMIGGGYLVISERQEQVPFIANFSHLDPSAGNEVDKNGAFSTFSYNRVVTALSEVFTK